MWQIAQRGGRVVQSRKKVVETVRFRWTIEDVVQVEANQVTVEVQEGQVACIAHAAKAVS